MPKFNSLDTQAKTSFIDKAKSVGRSILTAAQRLFNRLVKSGQYDLGKEIRSNPWYKMPNGGREAAAWFKSYATNPDVQIRRKYMEPGKLYMFVYSDPKTKDWLAVWDETPLCFCMGGFYTQSGEWRSVGLSLHFVPLEVRFVIAEAIFRAFASKYKGELYRTEQTPVFVDWHKIAPIVQPYGGAFAFREYIPERITGLIEITYENWSKAIFIPSSKYNKMTAEQVFAMYMQYLKDNNINFAVSDNRMI